MNETAAPAAQPINEDGRYPARCAFKMKIIFKQLSHILKVVGLVGNATYLNTLGRQISVED